MNKRRMHVDDKEKMLNTYKGMWSNFAQSVLALFKDGEEITLKELSKRSKQINGIHRFKECAINKVLTNELKKEIVSCGKNRWKLKGLG